ncbi:zinc finger protein zpr1 [Microthyrium microscopicum]|uniref:Zinc finger protein zpr1 n=1 Tax=Microthyrium microscopicum TaxID=703497 RepID=A0A6A6U9N0_9PEZI|nr:zinc finger protein zpr1 [Microthyrium microscopicum]
MSTGPQLFESVGAQAATTGGDATDDEPRVVDEIESLCMNCHEDGMTRLLLTKIPFFREIIIMSFACEHCHFKNSEIQSAGEIQQRGHKYTFKVENTEDLSRQLIKSDTCTLRIEDIDLEVPAGRGQLTNIEGVLSTIAQDLSQKQDERKEAVPEVYEKIASIITSLQSMASSTPTSFPFTITANDPAGNSWIEPSPTDTRGKLIRADYNRTPEQNTALGLSAQEPSNDGVEMRPEYHPSHMYPAQPTDGTTATNNVDADHDPDDDIVENQVYTFPATCPGCMQSCDTHMKMVNIPHFKQVVIMSTVCAHCGYRSNEVKTGGAVPDLGRRITIHIKNSADLSRDILKSESCALSCSELALSVEPGTLGGRFTTIEGLLVQVRDDLKANVFDADGGGDSLQHDEKGRWEGFFSKLDKAIAGEMEFTLVLEDPLAGSYVQSLAEVDGEIDAAITVEDYTRTEQEEEELGLRDIKTEGYEEGHKKEMDDKKEKEAVENGAGEGGEEV